jgi:hypothetical protein
MNEHDNPQFHSFECEAVPLPPGTRATPRAPDRPREICEDRSVHEATLVTFECVADVLPPGTPAAPRPPGRPRDQELVGTFTLTEADATFAHELAERVLEYVQNRSGGLSVEQLTTLVQQCLARHAR